MARRGQPVAGNANDTELDFTKKWTMKFRTTSDQQYECIFNGKKVQCYSLRPNGRRWLTLIPIQPKGFQIFYNKVAVELIEFKIKD